MGVIKINNIIYGSNNSADIIYKNTTVEEKLNSIPIFDPSDNANIEAGYDFLTYAHIVDDLTSNVSNRVLSANQGRVLNEKIDNIDLSGINNNANDIVILNERVNTIEEEMANNEVITNLDNRITENTNNISELNESIFELNNNFIKYNKNSDSFDIYLDGIYFNSVPAGVNAIGLIPFLNVDDGKIIHSGSYNMSAYPPYKAFNGTNKDGGDCWVTPNNTTTGNYLGYNFGKPTIVKRIFFANRISDNAEGVRAITSFTLQGSDNLSTWNNIQAFSVASAISGATQEFEVTNWQTYNAFRIYITGTTTSAHCAIGQLQFYGNN